MVRLSITKKLLKEKLKSACKGYRIYRKIKKANNIKKEDPVIVFPYGDKECIIHTLTYLDQFIDKLMVKPTGVYIITDIDNLEIYTNYTKKNKIKKIININSIELNQLIDYYSCSDFFGNMFIGSIVLPQSRIGKEYIGFNNITKEDLIVKGVLGIREYTKASSTVGGEKFADS